MRLKSLTMRIWLTISAFICAIMLIFLFFFALVLKDNDEQSSRYLFEFTHSVILNELQGHTVDDSFLGSIEREPITHLYTTGRTACAPILRVKKASSTTRSFRRGWRSAAKGSPRLLRKKSPVTNIGYRPARSTRSPCCFPNSAWTSTRI